MTANRLKTNPNLHRPAAKSSTEDSKSPDREGMSTEVMADYDVTSSSVPVKREGVIERYFRKQELANREWRAPVDFYGKVVDETGEPVAGANIVFGLNNLQGHSTIETWSDSSGLFELRNEKGKHLSVHIGKEGYYTSSENLRGFFYAGSNDDFIPDQRNQLDPNLEEEVLHRLWPTSALWPDLH